MKIVLTFFSELAFFTVAINWYYYRYSAARTLNLSCVVYTNIGMVQGVLNCHNKVINRFLAFFCVIVLSLKIFFVLFKLVFIFVGY